MKKIYLFTSLLFSIFSMTAQTTVQGKIADEKNQPIPFSSVALIAAKDSHLIKGALTDEQGAFSIPSVSKPKKTKTAGTALFFLVFQLGTKSISESARILQTRKKIK